MATMTLTYKMFLGWRNPLRDFIYRLLHGKGAKTDKSICEEVAEIERAIRTIQLARHPGESYEIVAARIEQEASRYRAFLRNPQPIGKIELKVKHLNSPLRSLLQYQVNDPSEGHEDPAEGRASFCYKYKRSNSTILEFFVHDENKQPLFPIARTYSNWLGSKEFDLGLDRTFYLNMLEDEPGYVKVHAGFVPFASETRSYRSGRDRVQQFPARLSGMGRMGFKPSRFAFFQMFQNAMGHLSSSEAVFISIICGSIFWTAVVGPRANGGSVGAQSLAGQRPAFDSGDDQIKSLFRDEWPRLDAVAVTQGAAASIGSGARAPVPMKPSDRRLEATRLQDVRQVMISVEDHSFCKGEESGCRELFASVQKGVKSQLSRLDALSHSNRPRDGGRLVKLLIAYKPTDWQGGYVYVTFYGYEDGLWKSSQEIDCGANDDSILLTAFCSETSWQILSEVIGQKTIVSLPARDKDYSTTE